MGRFVWPHTNGANPVFQPANLGVRGAWVAGGVEWNACVYGHSPHNCSSMFAALVEEVLVVKKRLRATEEIRITKRRSVRHEPQQVTLRREEAVVERLQPARDDDDPR